ncbi:MAG: DUF5688 family protein [Blautia sp.]|uniref:DUF5688 family protein n=1 Tax=Blautia sp. TaxID=1955243 RepID=UPI002E7A6E1A|nr:DUF5688 family protein [Blautia sp.]MED9883431.1 DUF5688 family protein [Blautia sp.]
MDNRYESFVETFRQKLIDATGYGEDRIFYKSREEYPPTSGDRLFVKQFEANGVTEVCALYVGDLYEEYRRGLGMDMIVKDVVKRLQGISRTDIIEKAKIISDYDKIKNYLFIRLINKNKYEADLRDSVYRTIGDIAMVLYVRMGEIEGYTSSMKVKQYMLEKWDMDRDEVFEAALLNTYFISPPRIYCWEKMLFDTHYEGENFMNLLSDYPIRRGAVGNCLSTVKRTNGAVAVFLPGVASRLADLMQGNLYLVFTSIHEVMIHNEKTADPEDLRHVLIDTIKETTPEEDVLTFHIYHYDRATGIFSLCDEED